MAKMLEGFNRLYCGKEAFARQLALFSICGVLGLYNAYLGLEQQGLAEVTQLQKYGYLLLWIVFGLFFTGYEVLFLHERQIPEIDMRSLKIVFNKILFFVFVISVQFTVFSLFLPKYTLFLFGLEVLFSVPLTMLQSGYSYNFQDTDAGMLFQKFRVKEYFLLILKRLWLIFISYVVTFSLVFSLFFAAGIVIALIYKGDINTISFVISSQQVAIAKLSSFIAGIILIYSLTIATLVWDYELITTYEREEL